MLTDAIEALKAGIVDEDAVQEEAWSPTIAIGTPVTIPEDYVTDLQVRLQLYRRLAAIEGEDEIESFAAEMIDRFGPLPEEVKQFLEAGRDQGSVRARRMSRRSMPGRMAWSIAFRDNSFADPQGLVRFISEQGKRAKVRPDHKIVFVRDFDDAEERLDGTRQILRTLANIAGKKKAA